MAALLINISVVLHWSASEALFIGRLIPLAGPPSSVFDQVYWLTVMLVVSSIICIHLVRLGMPILRGSPFSSASAGSVFSVRRTKAERGH
jgi:hypothetical protein